MKKNSYKKPRYKSRCIFCGKVFVLDKKGLIPKHFDKANPRKIGFAELPCPGSGTKGILELA